MHSRIFWLLAIFLPVNILSLTAQDQPVPNDWFLLDYEQDGYFGISAEKAYTELLRGRTASPVIVAVIDGGVQADHPDLTDVMWRNPGEVADGRDNDGNGLVDDIFGWNYIGHASGENVQYDNLELTRVYQKYHERFHNLAPGTLAKKDRQAYEEYQQLAKTIQKKRQQYEPEVTFLGQLVPMIDSLLASLHKPAADVTLGDLQNYTNPDHPMLVNVARALIENMNKDNVSFGVLYQGTLDYYEHVYSQYCYYNTEMDSRAIVGDNQNDPYERHYGNPDVEGPDGTHGTHVAGLIGASRDNGIGIKGVADKVQIMALRVVPDGDERDKDVANAIRYAVDHGAKIINMSFGKGYSPNKQVVDEAVKYAVKQDVLLVHGAGNDGRHITHVDNFPNDRFDKTGFLGPRYAKSWIEVGASTSTRDEALVADFSNYSGTDVDIFAPGVKMYSTVAGGKYRHLQGTSMASPVVAGAAAVLRSYFPHLRAAEVKDILLRSSVRYTGTVVLPDDAGKIAFSSLSTSGGVLNLYEAVRMAIARS